MTHRLGSSLRRRPRRDRAPVAIEGDAASDENQACGRQRSAAWRLLRHSSGPVTTLGKVEAWMRQTGCVAVVDHQTQLPFRPAVQIGVHGDFDNRARRYVSVECEHDGGYVTYERFASPRALQRALAHSRSIRRTNLCIKGSDALQADLVSRGYPTSGLCRALHGHFRPRLDPPCHHPGGLSIARYDRIVAREEAGAPCAFGALDRAAERERTTRDARGDEEDGWHPKDMLVTPLIGSDGELLGLISLDDAAGGRRPGDDLLDTVAAVAAIVASVIEHAHVLAESARRRAGQVPGHSV